VKKIQEAQMNNEKIKKNIKITLYVMAIIAVFGILYRGMEYLQLKHATEKASQISVLTTKAISADTPEEIILPGYVVAWHDATIYARTNGYIESWKVDIGARVKQGDLLAVISAPEVNAALKQTEADLVTAIANYNLAETTAKRWVFLLKTNSVSKQETDEKVSDAKAKKAIVDATTANRNRLRDLVSFQRVLAPFDGIVAARNTDIGRLINSGSGAKLPLFRIVQSDPLRIYVRVPQYYAARINNDLKAQLLFPDHPGKRYPARLLNTAEAIDAATRTLLIQLITDNHEYELLSGGYVKVFLTIPGNKNFVRLPVNTLLFRADGLHVAAIDEDHKATLKPITINRDFGDYVEISSGVRVNERIIINPPDSLMSGQEVRIIDEKSYV
jgi:RND family efflux transporter MFP subunit